MKDNGLPALRHLHYVEAFDHTELVYRWLPVWAQLEITVTVYLNERYRQQAEDQSRDWPGVRIKSPRRGQSWFDYLNGLRFTPEDFTIVGTFGRRPGWFLPLTTRVKFGVVLHNLNYCFERDDSVVSRSGLKAFLRKMVRQNHLKAKQALLEEAAVFILPNSAMTANCSGEYVDVRKITIPFAHQISRGALTPVTGKDSFVLVVPGTVRETTRNYAILRDALLKISLKPGQNVNVHLAGRVKDSAVIKMLAASFPLYFDSAEAEFGEKVQIVAYPDGLSEQNYARLLSSADIIVAPLRQTVTAGLYREQVGSTKVSGAFYDAIHYDKPILLPAWYDGEGGHVECYENEQSLSEKLQLLLTGTFPVGNWDRFSEFRSLNAWKEVVGLLNGAK